VSAGGTGQNGLYLFDPEDQNWRLLTEFNFIDPPLWSPDGEWLAFRVQDGEGRDEIYAIRRDGMQLTNLSANENLPAEGQPYVLNGWISNNVILRGRDDGIYLLRVDDNLVKPLFDTPWKKSDFVPSPDGYFLAYSDVTDAQTVLKLLTPDGKTTRELGTFASGSIYPLEWSPDGTRLAFAKITNDPAQGQDVYIIDSDGRNLQQVYHSQAAEVDSLHFSPDGRYLLFKDYDATSRHLFVIDLSTMEKHMLMVPNLSLDWWWMAPSWQR
jgi:Tol biopolymer transport system component